MIITEAGIWGKYEKEIASELKERKIPFCVIINKIDLAKPDEPMLEQIKPFTKRIVLTSVFDENREEYINAIKRNFLEIIPKQHFRDLPLLRDLVPEGGICVMIIPIDSEAPKGRIILPQVQAIRDILDGNAAALTVKETEYPAALDMLSRKPDLVVCDSQVVDYMVANTPEDIKCTTFSMLFSRFKGDLHEEVAGGCGN